MRDHELLHVRASGNFSCLLGSGVVAAQVLGSALRLSATAGEDPRQVGFVNEDVGVFGEANQGVAGCGVAGDDDRLSAAVEAVTEGGNYGAMVHVEGCDLQAVAIVDSSL